MPIASSEQTFASAIANHRQGRLEDAARLYEAILAIDGAHVGALHNLGLIRSQQGRLADAARLLDLAVARAPDEAAPYNNLGGILLAAGDYDAAAARLEQALALDPGLTVARCNLGIALNALRRPQEAKAHFERVLAAEPSSVAALVGLGNALQASGRAADALRAYERAIALRPDAAEAHNNLGSALHALGRYEDARAAYAQALAIDADYGDARYNLGKALDALGRHDAAVVQFERAIALRPEDAAALNDLGNALQALGRHDAAIARYERAIALRPDVASAHNNLANSLHALGRHKAAITEYERAIALKPDGAEAYANMGEALKEMGRLDAARDAFERAIAREPERAGLYLGLADVTRFAADDAHLKAMETLQENARGLPPQERIELGFALGKALADLGRCEESFRQLRQANASKRREISYDEPTSLALLDRVAATFTRETMTRHRDAGAVSPLPIFIVGMPRSGTTLVEQILASHPRVFGAGELPDFGEVVAQHVAFPEAVTTLDPASLRRIGTAYCARLGARAPDAAGITDKTPSNFLFAGLIALALPQARIIHVRRDPGDTCFSCFATLFSAGQPFAYDLGELGRYYRAYDRLMAHWRRVLPEGTMIELRYEALVADLAGEARRLVAFCGLDWDAACLAFHRTPRVVRTASAAQVRQPIYRSSLGRARAYGDLLRPLLDALGPDLAGTT
jgi:tetratricopeptide (TPR) repeat protein